MIDNPNTNTIKHCTGSNTRK